MCSYEVQCEANIDLHIHTYTRPVHTLSPPGLKGKDHVNWAYGYNISLPACTLETTYEWASYYPFSFLFLDLSPQLSMSLLLFIMVSKHTAQHLKMQLIFTYGQ